MQQLADLDARADRVDARSPRKRKTSARRKVTVRLSEGVCGRLDVAAERPGVGKSMLVEAALEDFLTPAPSVEALLRERLDDMHARFDRFEHDMRMIAETVALHARYQLAVTPPVPSGNKRRSSLVTSVSRFWRNRSIAALDSADLSCRRRSTISIPSAMDERSRQQAGKPRKFRSRSRRARKRLLNASISPRA